MTAEALLRIRTGVRKGIRILVSIRISNVTTFLRTSEIGTLLSPTYLVMIKVRT